jgi:rhodanese-related sulfurtransferase
MPSGHGSYRGLELELLDPGDEDELMLLLQAQHAERADALDSGDEVIVDGEAFSPRLHLAMHQIVANQLLADDPPETWQAVQRLAGLGYDWHNVMHMIARLVSDDVYQAINDGQQFAPAEYVRRLEQLPGDKQVVLHCKSGARSAEALAIVKAAGYKDAVHVGGGVVAWVNQIDPSQPSY